MQRSRIGLVLAVMILAISLVILAWGLLPGERIIERQTIKPTEMQLPTPSSFIPIGKFLASQDNPYNAARIVSNGSDRFVLLFQAYTS